MATAPKTTGVNRPVKGSGVKTAAAGTKLKPVEGKTENKAPPPPPFQIVPMTKRTRWLKLLIYGGFGVGKTFLAGTAVGVDRMNDILLMNAEKGDLTLEGDEYDFDAIEVVNVSTYKEVARVVDFLVLHCALRDSKEPEDIAKLKQLDARMHLSTSDQPRKYRTVIIDSLTEVEVFCMYQLLGISDLTKLDEETASAEWAEYKRNTQMIQLMLRKLRDLPLNVIFICSRRQIQDDRKRFNYSPSMTGQLSNIVQGFVDMVGYLTTGKVTEESEGAVIPRRMFVQPVGPFSAKCRFSQYKAPYFDNPTIEGILKAVGLAKPTKGGT